MSARIIPFPEHRIVRRFDSPMTKSLANKIADFLTTATDKSPPARKEPRKPRKKTAKAVDCG